MSKLEEVARALWAVQCKWDEGGYDEEERARLEHDLNYNLLHGTSGMGSLSGLLEGN